MKQKKKKIPFVVHFISWGFPKLEKMSPKTANKWALNLFFTPIRFPIPPQEKELVAQAKLFSMTYKDTHLQGYQWGTSEKRIFLAHGWAGRSSQLYKFVIPLIEQGYQVIAIDQLAHGKSKGKRTNIVDFVNVIKLVLEKFNSFDGVIAHSMGGVATLLTLKENASIKKFICISAPTLSEKILTSFQEKLKASTKVVEHIRSYVENRYQTNFKDFFASSFSNDALPQTPTLIIHDQGDKDVSLDNATTLHKLLPQSELLITEGLGHTRILRDENVIQKTIFFLKEKNP